MFKYSKQNRISCHPNVCNPQNLHSLCPSRAKLGNQDTSAQRNGCNVDRLGRVGRLGRIFTEGVT